MNPSTQSQINGRWLAPWAILVVGIVAAFGPGKLAALLPAIQHELGMSLLAGGWLVAMFQLAAALLGLLGGALADRFGARRIMQAGLIISALGAFGGAISGSVLGLFISRATESLGFILAVLPAAALFRRCLQGDRLMRWLGAWGTYMPTGMAIALIASPLLATSYGWRAAWTAHGVVLLVGMLMVRVLVPRDPPPTQDVHRFLPLMAATGASAGPWLLAATFAVYAGQYIAIVSFLPSAYQEAGIAPTLAGLLTAGVAGINLIGNITAGLLAQRGVQAGSVIGVAALALLTGPWLAFSGDGAFWFRYGAICVTSLVAGVIPGTLFTLVPRFAPSTSTMSTTVGLMMQGSGVGQVAAPPLVAGVAMIAGGWHLTGVVTGLFAVATLLLAAAITRYARGR